VGAQRRQIDPLRYQSHGDRSLPSPASRTDEIAFVKLRYKLPGEAASRLVEQPVRTGDALKSIDNAPAEQRFATAVVAFGQHLRGENALDGYDYASVAALANSARGTDAEGYRAEFVRLVRIAETLSVVAQR